MTINGTPLSDAEIAVLQHMSKGHSPYTGTASPDEVGDRAIALESLVAKRYVSPSTDYNITGLGLTIASRIHQSKSIDSGESPLEL